MHLHHCQFVSHCLVTAILEMLNTTEDEDRMLKGETGANISGFYKQATQLRTCSGAVRSEALLRPSVAICRAKTSTARAAVERVQVLQQQLQTLKETDSVRQLKVNARATIWRSLQDDQNTSP